jgi:DNA-binding MarR family transcriptional regulator
VSRKDFNDLFADTLAKLHINNTQIQELKSFKKEVTRNLNALVRNAVVLSLEQGDKTKEEVAEDVGVDPSELDDLLVSMEDENQLRREEDTYTVRA